MLNNIIGSMADTKGELWGLLSKNFPDEVQNFDNLIGGLWGLNMQKMICENLAGCGSIEHKERAAQISLQIEKISGEKISPVFIQRNKMAAFPAMYVDPYELIYIADENGKNIGRLK